MERVLLHALTPALESTFHLRSSLHTSHSRTKLWMLTLIRPNIVEEDYHHLIWMPLQGFRWFLCCRQGFSLLGRDYGEREEEESFELRNNENLTSNGRVNWPHFAFDSNYIFTYCTFKRFVYYMPFFSWFGYYRMNYLPDDSMFRPNSQAGYPIFKLLQFILQCRLDPKHYSIPVYSYAWSQAYAGTGPTIQALKK